MSTILDYRYQINGVISADKTVMQNIETIAGAAGAWVAFDVNRGLWSVIINKPGTSSRSFNDDNIIGSLTISATGLTELYNGVRVEFPHIDLNDQSDFIQDLIPSELRNPNEPDNLLGLQYDCINDPVQAEILGLLELKQSRQDIVVNFKTDYSALGIKAGDIIDISNDLYGFEEKLFRVTTVSETDEGNGVIQLAITALAYSDDVYDLSDLYRYERSNSTGIITAGSIPAPGTPVLTSFTNTSRPRLRMNSTVTLSSINSVIEGIEFWYSSDNDNYYLAGVDRPTNDTTYVSGEVASFEWSDAPTGNIWIRARGFNSQTTGPFSDAGSLQYIPVQTTDAISNDTDVLDDNGDAITNMLGASALLELVNGLFDGDTGLGSLFDQVANLNSQTGAISGNAGNVSGLWQGAARYVSSTQPTGSFNNGDVWFKV